MCEICQNWARDGVGVLSTAKGPLMSNHHPGCPRYGENLMDVWVVSDGTSRCYVDNEQDAKDTCQNEGEEKNTIEKIRLPREVFEALPEFDGF